MAKKIRPDSMLKTIWMVLGIAAVLGSGERPPGRQARGFRQAVVPYLADNTEG